MYQALYRKWRPKTFSEVVGQAHITSTLCRQVAEERVGHAYLFTGSRGTAVNCEHPVDGAPCCRCEACLGIDNGTLLDVTELDAASNNGVDQVRALRDEAVYPPARLKKRVYIIDEVHMLSTAAFNALLKTLEEPPEHLLFILATTELQKVPATILSRCQRFSFKRILPRDIQQQLMTIARAEEIDLAPDGAELLSRIANGAMRDALSLLDQCRVREGVIDAGAVLDMLGLAGNTQTIQLMRCLLARSSGDALALFDQLYRSGKDVTALLGELSDLARDMTILRAAPEGGQALLTGFYDRKSLQELSGQEELRRFLYMTQTLQQCSVALGDSLRPRTDAELCLLRLCDETLSGDLAALTQRVAALERGAPRPAATRSAPPTSKAAPPVKTSAPPVKVSGPPAAAPTLPLADRDDAPPPPEEPGRFVYDDVPPAREPAPTPPRPAAKQAAPAGQGAGHAAAGDTAVWTCLLDHYKGRLSVNYRVFLNMASGVLAGDCLQVFCPNEFVRDSLRIDAVTTVLREVTAEHVGHPVRVELTIGAAPKAPAPAKKQAVPAGAAPAPAPTPTPVQTPEQAPEKPAEKPAAPADETPPWEEKHDALDDLMAKGGQLDNFKIK